MRSAFGNRETVATISPEGNLPSWRLFSEPLWFAVMCRELWGAQGWKELRFHLGDESDDRTERTYRAWASGDNVPRADVLAMLILSPVGPRILDHITRGAVPKWRAAELDDQRQAAIFRGAMREVACNEKSILPSAAGASRSV